VTNSGLELVESLQSQLDVFKKELDAIKKLTTMLGNMVDTIKTTANNAKLAAERAEKRLRPPLLLPAEGHVESEDDYDWEEGKEECIQETNLEVGELVERQHLPCMLVLIMEG